LIFHQLLLSYITQIFMWLLPSDGCHVQALTDQITHTYRVLYSTGWITDIFIMKLLSVINIKEVYLFSCSIFLHCLLSFGQQQKLKDTAFGCIWTVLHLFTVHTNCFLLFSYFLHIQSMFQEELHILSLTVAWCEHINKYFRIYKRSDQGSLGGSACHLYLGAAWFEYWLEDRQTWMELMWFFSGIEYLIRPLIHPSTSFIIHQLSCHWTLYDPILCDIT
jgi:hypothetical protein